MEWSEGRKRRSGSPVHTPWSTLREKRPAGHVKGGSLYTRLGDPADRKKRKGRGGEGCQGHSSLNAPSELNPPQRIPSLFETPLVPQAEG